jgi:pimeloyl-ACP methyl ester carboxylesterase
MTARSFPESGGARAATPSVFENPVEEGSIPVADGSLFYSVTGNGPAVVFAHGLGGNYRSWFQQVGPFAQGYRCVTFSHRGFLPSQDVSGLPNPQWFAKDLARLFDHLEIDKAAIVAQSMGGWTAMEFALNWPKRVSSLALCGTAGTLRHPGIVSLAETANDPGISACRARGIHPAAGARMALEQPALHEKFLEIDRASGSWDRSVVRMALDAMRTRDQAALAAITCPVLALVGAEDLTCPPSNVEILAATLTNVELRVVPEAGHSVYFERADIFNELVLGFLRKSEWN